MRVLIDFVSDRGEANPSVEGVLCNFLCDLMSMSMSTLHCCIRCTITAVVHFFGHMLQCMCILQHCP